MCLYKYELVVMVYWVGILANLNPTGDICQGAAVLQRGGVY